MAETKKPATKKKTTKPKVEYLGLDEAAEFIGITPHELQLSRYRGVEPGALAEKKDGVLVWEKGKLTAKPADEEG